MSTSPVTGHIVLAYAGGLEDSAALLWLCRNGGATVVTVTLDLGQGADPDEIRSRALALGALRAHVLDARDEFARDCVLPALQSGAFHDARAPIGRIVHPLVARKLVAIAAIEQATAVAHSGGLAAHASIAAAVGVLRPQLPVVAAVLEAGLVGTALEAFARQHGLSMAEDRRRRPRSAARAPDVPAHVEVRFEDGVPVSVNDVVMPLTELIESVATIAGNHGVGRDGSDGDGVPCDGGAALVLSDAYEALMDGGERRATGVVRVRLFRGEHAVVGQLAVTAP